LIGQNHIIEELFSPILYSERGTMMSDPSSQLPNSVKLILNMLETKKESATWRINIQKNGPYFDESFSSVIIQAFERSTVTQVSFYCYNDVLESNKNIDALIEAIATSSNITYLEWSDYRDVQEQKGESMLFRCLVSAFTRHGNKSIKSVFLRDSVLDLQLLADFYHRCSNALCLHMEDCSFVDGMDNIDFRGLQNLHSLILSRGSDGTICKILKNIGKYPKSLTLDLSYFSNQRIMRPQVAMELKTLLLTTANLRHLRLSGIRFREDKFTAIHEGLQKSTTIGKVSLEKCCFDDICTEQLKNLFSSTQSLHGLFLRHSDLLLPASYYRDLSTVIHSKCLREFALDDDEKMNDTGLHVVCSAMENNSSLRVLKIGRINNGVWLGKISTILAKNKNLQEFHARFLHNQYQKSRKSDFLEAVGRNFSLHVIQDYSQTFFSESEKAQLARIMARNKDAAKLLSASKCDNKILRKLPEVYHCLFLETNCGLMTVLRNLLDQGDALGFSRK
jgi:hypothetical protein